MKLQQLRRAAMILFYAGVLQGCVAAAAVPLLAASMATSGFIFYKSVQTTSGGSVSIGFNDPDIAPEDKVALSAITHPGIWPGNEVQVTIANTLENTEGIRVVITPATVTRLLVEYDVDANVNLMTTTEALSLFRRVCAETGADALIAFKDGGSEANSNFWSFNRANTVYRNEILIYSSREDRIVFTTELEITVERSGDIQNEQEVYRITGEAAAEKFIELREA